MELQDFLKNAKGISSRRNGALNEFFIFSHFFTLFPLLSFRSALFFDIPPPNYLSPFPLISPISFPFSTFFSYFLIHATPNNKRTDPLVHSPAVFSPFGVFSPFSVSDHTLHEQCLCVSRKSIMFPVLSPKINENEENRPFKKEKKRKTDRALNKREVVEEKSREKKNLDRDEKSRGRNWQSALDSRSRPDPTEQNTFPLITFTLLHMSASIIRFTFRIFQNK